MLATAKTAADHEAIADYYDDEAADAHAKYEEHQAEAARYEGIPKWETWSLHCARLAQDFKQVEKDVSVLAADQRMMAEEMTTGREMSVDGSSEQTQ